MHPKELDEIDQQLAELQTRRQAVLDATRQESLTAVKAAINLYRFTAMELGLSAEPQGGEATARPKTPAKYADPKNPGKTWAGGKGPKPVWVQEHLARGGALDELLIVKPSVA